MPDPKLHSGRVGFPPGSARPVPACRMEGNMAPFDRNPAFTEERGESSPKLPARIRVPEDDPAPMPGAGHARQLIPREELGELRAHRT